MNDIEKIFVSPYNKVYIQFALEVTNPRYLQPILQKIKNATSGLYIKSDGTNLLSNFKDFESITIHKIPKEIKTLTGCCDWIYHTLTPAIDYSLASIAADETRIVVNSNHSITDGGFFSTLLNNLQNSSSDHLFTEKAPIPRDLRNDLLKIEFDDFLEKRKQFIGHWPSFKQSDLTYLNLQENVSIPGSHKNSFPERFIANIDCKDLSPYIYDKNTGKINHMTDYLWDGLCFAINAKNETFEPIDCCSCMDFRRLLPKGRVDHSFGNSFTNFILAAQNVNPKMTVGEICSKLRTNFNLLKAND